MDEAVVLPAQGVGTAALAAEVEVLHWRGVVAGWGWWTPQKGWPG
ncbi:MAG: hypothetical protein WB524_02665 [Acidobacteriaceae bacterium]